MVIRDFRRLYTNGTSAVSMADVMAAAAKNPAKFMERHLWIADKKPHKPIQRFKLNASQQLLEPQIQEEEDAGKPVRDIILKSRQVGISSHVNGRYFARAWSLPLLNVLMLTHLDKVTQRMFARIRLFHEKLPPKLQHPVERNNKEELIFSDIKTGLYTATAKTLDAARGLTWHYLHFSEAAFYEDFAGVLMATEGSCPFIAGTSIIIESTANGMNDFYAMWDAAVRGEIAYRPRFLEWFKDPECSLPPFANDRDRDARLEYVFSKRPELKERQKHYQLTAEQICWYFDTLIGKYKGDLLHMQQEFPCSPAEAFLSTGTPIVAQAIIDRYVERTWSGELYDPFSDIRNLDNAARSIRVERNKTPYLEVWIPPRPKKHYLISVDCAGGLDTSDPTCMMVFDIQTQQVVAEVHGKIDTTQAAGIAAKLAELYNNALIVPEVDGMGIAFLAAIKTLYYNIYRQRKRVESGYTDVLTNKLGWETNPETRNLMIGCLRRSMEERVAEERSFVPDIETFIELRTFVNNNGKAQAEKGKHDDRVMALMIGLYACFQELAIRPELALPAMKKEEEQPLIIEARSPAEVLAMIKDPAWTGVGPYIPSLNRNEPFYTEREIEDIFLGEEW